MRPYPWYTGLMNLKKLTHLTFPYAFLLVLLLAVVGTVVWSDPLAWLEQVLAIERYWLTLTVYGLLLVGSTVFAPLTVAVTVPFMAEIFSPFAIFVTSWLSWMLGSMIVFWLSRRYGKPLVKRFFSMDRLEQWQNKMPTHLDFWVLLLLRTFVPADVLSYAVGLFSTINFRKYALATAIGIIPFTFILSYGPEAISGDNPWLLFSFLVLALTIVTALVIFYFSALLRPRVKIYTHDNKFHADDVFAVATVQMVLEQQQRRYEVIRSRDPELLQEAQEAAERGDEVFIIDIGQVSDPEHKQFDHHQMGGAGARESGVQYASFGLVWRDYGVRLCGNVHDVAQEVDRLLVQAIDGPDNGQALYTLTDLKVDPLTLGALCDWFRTVEHSDATGLLNNFEQAVAWAKQVIPLAIQRAASNLEQSKRAGQIYAEAEDKRVMLSEDRVSPHHFIRYPEALLCVAPRYGDVNREWGIAIVPTEATSKRGRIAFPTTWWGLSDEALQEVSGISGARFVHRSGDFIAVAHSKKAAMDMVEKTLAQL